MGNCIKSNSLADNEFEVFYISNMNKLHCQESRSRGVLRITDTKILFTFKTDKSIIEWQFKYIRQCGCDTDENFFTIDVGSKCPTGKGSYFFNTEHAQEMYNLYSEIVTRKSRGNETLDGVSNAIIESSPRYENQEIANKPTNPSATNKEPIQSPDKGKALSYPEISFVDNAESANKSQSPKVSCHYSSIDPNKTDMLKKQTDERKQRKKVMLGKLQIEQQVQNDDGPMRSPYVNVPDSSFEQQSMETDQDNMDQGNKFIPPQLKLDENEQGTQSNDEPMPSPYVNMPESPYTKNYVEIDHKEEEMTNKNKSKPPGYNYSTMDEAATVALTKVKQKRDEEKKQNTCAKHNSNQTKETTF